MTAWVEGLLVGTARTLTGFCYVGYLGDLAVRIPISAKASALS